MKDDIVFDVIGNTGPFSLVAESSGYAVTVNGNRYLLECGVPVFPVLGFHGAAAVKGVFATHSHEDHRRWFTDLVLFNYYESSVEKRVRLISSETVLEEYHKNSKGALERSLSSDSKRIVDIPYKNMVEERVIGPRSRYFIFLESEGEGRFQYTINDREGNRIGPEKAKIFINPEANRPRLLYRDDDTGEWVEPESYYPFSASNFYEENQNCYVDSEAGLTVQAVKAAAWHGVPTVAFKFITEKNCLFFSADTVYNPSLWKELCDTYRPQTFDRISREDFASKSVLMGDINDFIERTWSRKRYDTAMAAYEDAVVIHDVARANSVVHTDYVNIKNANIENLIYTHNPDNLTAWRPILRSGKRLIIMENDVYESAKGALYPLDADVYIRHFSSNLVGYKSKDGPYKVIEKDGLLGVVHWDSPGDALMQIELYVDIAGEYFPVLEDPNKFYWSRPDGQVEEMTFNTDSSRGRVVRNLRGKIKKQS